MFKAIFYVSAAAALVFSTSISLADDEGDSDSSGDSPGLVGQSYESDDDDEPVDSTPSPAPSAKGIEMKYWGEITKPGQNKGTPIAPGGFKKAD